MPFSGHFQINQHVWKLVEGGWSWINQEGLGQVDDPTLKGKGGGGRERGLQPGQTNTVWVPVLWYQDDTDTL